MYDKLPSNTYTICFEKMSGFYLAKHTDIAVTKKIYGVHEEKTNKVLRSFAAFERSLGVILSGNKGIGKSLFAKRLREKAVAAGYPVLILDQFIPGVATYLVSIDQELPVYFKSCS